MNKDFHNNLFTEENKKLNNELTKSWGVGMQLLPTLTLQQKFGMHPELFINSP